MAKEPKIFKIKYTGLDTFKMDALDKIYAVNIEITPIHANISLNDNFISIVIASALM